MNRSNRVLGNKRVSLLDAEAQDKGVDCNSNYSVGDDISILLDEVLNNEIRSVLIYGDFGDAFGDIELTALAKVLSFNHSVLSLNLCGIHIGDDAITLLCDSLVHSYVRMIDLSNTHISDGAGASLVTLAQQNPNLRSIIVTETLITEGMLLEIDLTCQYNSTLGDPSSAKPLSFSTGKDRLCLRHCFKQCDQILFCPFSHRFPTLSTSHRDGIMLKNDDDMTRRISEVKRRYDLYLQQNPVVLSLDDIDDPKRLMLPDMYGGASWKVADERYCVSLSIKSTSPLKWIKTHKLTISISVGLTLCIVAVGIKLCSTRNTT